MLEMNALNTEHDIINNYCSQWLLLLQMKRIFCSVCTKWTKKADEKEQDAILLLWFVHLQTILIIHLNRCSDFRIETGLFVCCGFFCCRKQCGRRIIISLAYEYERKYAMHWSWQRFFNEIQSFKLIWKKLSNSKETINIHEWNRNNGMVRNL